MKTRAGFTVVELMITLVVGVLLIGSAYQLFGAISRNSTDAQRQSQASNLAYDLLRYYQNNPGTLSNPCVASATPMTPAIPGYTNLTGTTKVTVTCPQGTDSALSLVTVIITYNSSEGKAQVIRAITTQP